MKRNFLTLGVAVLANLLAVGGSQAQSMVSCATAVSRLSEQVIKSGKRSIKDQDNLVRLIRYIERENKLPKEYVTTRNAKEAGWSGGDRESLWEASWKLNGKMVGGDPVKLGALPSNTRWYSADYASVRGYRSAFRLIYSLDNPVKYYTPDHYRTLFRIPECE